MIKGKRNWRNALAVVGPALHEEGSTSKSSVPYPMAEPPCCRISCICACIPPYALDSGTLWERGCRRNLDLQQTRSSDF